MWWFVRIIRSFSALLPGVLNRLNKIPTAISLTFDLKKVPNLFIIAGCNGAGKTTSSFTVFPELLKVKEFVNADEIARGLSPFQPESVSMEAGRIMIRRLDELINAGRDFAFETTLSTRSFVSLCNEARQKSYNIYLVFLWLNEPELAIQRVAQRVSEGGHNIPEETIVRRYSAGLKNFINLYKDLVDGWFVMDNSMNLEQELIAEGSKGDQDSIHDFVKWNKIQSYG